MFYPGMDINLRNQLGERREPTLGATGLFPELLSEPTTSWMNIIHPLGGHHCRGQLGATSGHLSHLVGEPHREVDLRN